MSEKQVEELSEEISEETITNQDAVESPPPKTFDSVEVLNLTKKGNVLTITACIGKEKYTNACGTGVRLQPEENDVVALDEVFQYKLAAFITKVEKSRGLTSKRVVIIDLSEFPVLTLTVDYLFENPEKYKIEGLEKAFETHQQDSVIIIFENKHVGIYYAKVVSANFAPRFQAYEL